MRFVTEQEWDSGLVYFLKYTPTPKDETGQNFEIVKIKTEDSLKLPSISDYDGLIDHLGETFPIRFSVQN